jgi:hypothetical protein
MERTVVLGDHDEINGTEMVEVLTGLSAGQRVVLGHE